MKLVALFFAFFLAGCSPFVGYTHLSQPNVNDDGYDLVCGGFENNRRTSENTLRLDVSVCENLANSSTDTFARIDVRYVFDATR